MNRSAKTKKMKADLVQRDPINYWKVCVDHPIVLFYNTMRPSQILVENLLEKNRSRVLFEFDNIEIIGCDQFLSSP